ncbi:MAG: DNA repair exonuclease [Planctomycetes bacterium]|nr:DNA repair exonuclease [Planctomycetota bacterium]
MFRFLHVADIHLDSPLRGLERYEGAPIEKLRNATRQALRNLVQTAIDEQVAFVVIAGDLYDGDWRDYQTGLFLVGQMGRLRDANIPVFIIAGNHDAANKMTRDLRLPANVTVLGHKKPETFRLDDCQVAIHGQSFATQAVYDDLAAGYPAAQRGWFNIGLLHTCGTGREGHEPYAPCTLDTLRGKHYDYWALGHIHQREILHDDPPIVYSGNLQGRSVRETGPKGCMLVTVDAASRVHVEPRFLDVLRWQHCRVECAGATSTDEVLERVGSAFQNLVRNADDRLLAVRVELTGSCAIHKKLTAKKEQCVNEIRALANETGDAWVEKVLLRTAPQEAIDESCLADGPLGELDQLIAEIHVDHERLMGLGESLAELRRKLPAELQDGPDALDFDNPEQLRIILEQARHILVSRLIPAGGEA